jgi:HEAT repeat protein
LAEWHGAGATEALSGLLGDDPVLDEYLFIRLRECRTRYPERGMRDLESGLRRLLLSADRRVRRMAAGACEEHGLAIDALPALVDDEAASVRHAAIGACARLALRSSAKTIEAHFDDEDPEVRISAVTAYARLRPIETRVVDTAVGSEDCPWARKRMEFALKK